MNDIFSVGMRCACVRPTFGLTARRKEKKRKSFQWKWIEENENLQRKLYGENEVYSMEQITNLRQLCVIHINTSCRILWTHSQMHWNTLTFFWCCVRRAIEKRLTAFRWSLQMSKCQTIPAPYDAIYIHWE